jgi:hypothetical protein
MYRRDCHGGVVLNGSPRFRRTGSGFRFGYEKVWMGCLDRPDIVRRDDHAGAALGETPQSNGKVIL